MPPKVWALKRMFARPVNLTELQIDDQAWFVRYLLANPGEALHCAKGGAVETGCSDLYGVIHDFTI